MTQMPSDAAVVRVKAQPNIYTVLLIVAIVALAVTIGVVLYNLLAEMDAGYGLRFGQVLTGEMPKP